MDYLGLEGIHTPVSRIGFGCCPLGEHEWGTVDRDEMIRCVGEALDCGVTLFDTADIYGLGISEKNLAAGLGKRRSQAVVASKYGIRHSNAKMFYDSSPRWLRTALDGTLTRLKTDFLDLFQLHYWDGHTPLNEVAEEMERAREQGKILQWGITNLLNATSYSALFPRGDPFTFSYQLSLLDRDHEPIIRQVSESYRQSVFLAWGSLSQGLLSGKFGEQVNFDETDRRWRPEYRNFHGERYANCLKVVRKLQETAKALEKSTSQLVLRWILDGWRNSVVLVGVKKRCQLLENVGSAGWVLEKDHWAEIDGLTKED